MRLFRILIFEGYALSTKVHRRSLNRLKCTAKDRATILVSSLYNSLVFRLKCLFFFEVDVEVNQDIPIGEHTQTANGILARLPEKPSPIRTNKGQSFSKRTKRISFLILFLDF